MRIAQVAPLFESCPPQLYGGTERVVSHLTEELVRQGHDVTLFASGDSRTLAVLEPPCERALRLDPQCRDPLAHHMVLINRVARNAHLFDFIHFHTDYLHFPLFASRWRKTLTTLHGRLDLPDLPPLMREFPMMPLASISDAQRAPLSWANWCGTVHHGLPPDLFAFGRGAGGYLAFLGRISPEKGPERAIAIARRVGMPLVIAAKVDKVDHDYYKAEIRPLLNDPLIEFNCCWDGSSRFVDAVDHYTGHARLDNFRNRPASKGDNRCAAGHGFYLHESKRFRPVDWEQ